MIETDDLTRAAKEYSDAGVSLAELDKQIEKKRQELEALENQRNAVNTERDNLKQTLSDTLAGKKDVFAVKDAKDTAS